MKELWQLSAISYRCARGSDADFTRFLFMAMGSASEVENHLLLARDLMLVPQERFLGLQGDTTEVKRMLSALINKTRNFKR